MLFAACQPAAEPSPVEEEVVEEVEEVVVEEPAVGSAERPVKVMFVPSHDAEEIIAGGDILADVLAAATGLNFEVSVPTSYIATIEEMCASPEDTMGFIPGLGYVLANQICGVQVAGMAERYGYFWYTAGVFVPRDSEIDELSDLEGLEWASPGRTSTSGYIYPSFMFINEGITPGPAKYFNGSHEMSMTALYMGEVDFAIGYYSPPRIDGTTIEGWLPGDDRQFIPEDLVESCGLTEDGKTILCGNYEPRGARRAIRKFFPDVMQKLRLLTTTVKITNDTLSFGPDFPADVKDSIMTAIFDYAESDPESFGEALDAYSWSSIAPAVDADYDPIRDSVKAIGFELEDLASN